MTVKHASSSMTNRTIFATSFGPAAIVWSGLGIRGLRLPDRKPGDVEGALRRRFSDAVERLPPADMQRVIDGVIHYFRGDRVDFANVLLELDEPDPFFDQVYRVVRGLRWGETTSYGAIATLLSAGPEGARRVGRAMARNPIPLIIPCHRVLGAGGAVGGFSAPGGAGFKAAMLGLEGVSVVTPVDAGAQAAFRF
jgi:methylated-DNA-[protein]-cysteine S-methyltransferase